MERATPYDRHLAYREEFMSVGPRFFLRSRLMRSMLNSRRGRLLDVGCGDGFFLEQLVALGFECAGLDVSEAMIERCRARLGSRAELFCGSIEAYAPAQPFDVAACGDVLEHIEDDLGTLRQIARLLKPGGLLVLSVPIDMRLWSEADRGAGHVRRYSKAEILSKIVRAGFRPERCIVWGWPITRALYSTIRHRQESLMSAPVGGGRSHALRSLMRWGRYLFLLDNLFNWTERGVGIVVAATRNGQPQLPAAEGD